MADCMYMCTYMCVVVCSFNQVRQTLSWDTDYTYILNIHIQSKEQVRQTSAWDTDFTYIHTYILHIHIQSKEVTSIKSGKPWHGTLTIHACIHTYTYSLRR
jgi:hypothetical protein